MPLRPRSRQRWLLDHLLGVTEPRHWQRRDWVHEVVFVCGTGHSGTTLLQRMLIANSATYGELRETDAFLRHSPWRELRQLRLRCTSAGRRVLVEKTPRHVNQVERIRSTVPGAKFVLLVRDGRDVAASVQARFGWDDEAAIAHWQRPAEAVAAVRESLDSTFIRYEDLIGDPRAILAQLCEFICIDFEQQMVDYASNELETDIPGAGVLQRGNPLRAWQISQRVFDGRGRYRTELTPAAAEAFSHGSLGELMRRFGYDVG